MKSRKIFIVITTSICVFFLTSCNLKETGDTESVKVTCSSEENRANDPGIIIVSSVDQEVVTQPITYSEQLHETTEVTMFSDQLPVEKEVTTFSENLPVETEFTTFSENLPDMVTDVTTLQEQTQVTTTGVTEAQTTTASSSTFAEQSSQSKGISDLPESIMYEVEYWQSIYPNMQLGVGLYSLDGTKGYQYNADLPMNTACTVKAPYALYVLKKCENEGIDIWSTFLTYEQRHDDCGSGNIMLYGYHGQEYSIAELLQLLLGVSDNVAFSMLLEEFPLSDFYTYNTAIGGENDWQKWGQASVQQRKNEWVAIYDYINSGSAYSSVLHDDLAYTNYAYLLQGMSRWHDYLQKSGWTEETFVYPSAADCAIIDDSYILIVITQDYSFGSGHIDVIQSIGNSVEAFWDYNGGNIF